MRVLDASAAVQACLSARGFALFSDGDLRAPPLLVSETVSVLHEMLWRREISTDLAATALDVLRKAPLRVEAPPSLSAEAWRVAEELGWAKTYDAEYVALARLLRCPLLTLDAKLARGAARLVKIAAPRES